MSKIICDVCGTSYPETATQCPICGSVRPADVTISNQADADTDNGGYTYVKGGRFSKSNVKKRNKLNKVKSVEASAEPEEKKSGGLVVLLVILLVILALLVAFVVYAALNQGSQGNTDPSDGTQQSQTSISCTALTLNFDLITLDETGETAVVKATPTPVNTTDQMSFASSDEAVVTVDSSGVVTYVGDGTATITVTCGNASIQCQVICKLQETTIPPEEFRLNRTAITFEMEGFTWTLYSGEIPMDQITWTTDNEAVAVIVDGIVTAVGEGETTVYGEYAGNKIGCKIVCEFKEEEATGGGNEGGENTGSTEHGTLHIYSVYFFNPNLYGDFSIDISVDDTLTLMLSDANGNEVEAAWSINSQPYASLSGSRVKGLIPGGKATVTATYNGQTYTCIIRTK